MKRIETINNQVAELRLEHDLTQEMLAIEVGVTRQTIIAIEKGNYVPSVLLAIKIATLFKKKVEDVFFITYEK
jgi:putative transcriptional regulator